jgi:hypothetical protein
MRQVTPDELHAWLLVVNRRGPVRLRDAAQTWQRPAAALLVVLNELKTAGRAQAGEMGWVAC